MGATPGDQRPDAGPPTLVVLAGQQPCLGGGPALVAHKAATAIALAGILTGALRRPVVPVFLLATDDHDSTEIDHVDFIDAASHGLRRLRCPVRPGRDSFWRSTWDERGLKTALEALSGTTSLADSSRSSTVRGIEQSASPISRHVSRLLLDVFGEAGLIVVESHRLRARALEILGTLLTSPDSSRDVLSAGALALRSLGLKPSFDVDDPRPLVLESHAGRRRRLASHDREATKRLFADPENFSPHAATRPLLQAASLPVIAQVCGPSELNYLAQARGLHALFGLTPPVLVPRMEGTLVSSATLDRFQGRLREVDLAVPKPASSESPELKGRSLAVDLSEGGVADVRDEFLRAAARFSRAVVTRDAQAAAGVERWLARLERDARRLETALVWRTRPRAEHDHSLWPRGRPQDTVLAWLPNAVRSPSLSEWGRGIISLARPLEAPQHIFYSPSQETAHG
ncbi:MAG: bacillithiol biosynthesis protein BshC [Planctomycetota bacterium]